MRRRDAGQRGPVALSPAERASRESREAERRSDFLFFLLFFQPNSITTTKKKNESTTTNRWLFCRYRSLVSWRVFSKISRLGLTDDCDQSEAAEWTRPEIGRPWPVALPGTPRPRPTRAQRSHVRIRDVGRCDFVFSPPSQRNLRRTTKEKPADRRRLAAADLPAAAVVNQPSWSSTKDK